MKKKLYEKPSMKVFELKQKPRLLAGSTPKWNDPYNGEDDWSI